MKTEEYKDQGLRQALQHKNEAAEKMTLPDDFTDHLMQRIEQEEEKPKHRSTWLYAAIGAVAASILLLLALHYTPNDSNTEDGTVVAQQTEQHLLLILSLIRHLQQQVMVQQLQQPQELAQHQQLQQQHQLLL